MTKRKFIVGLLFLFLVLLVLIVSGTKTPSKQSNGNISSKGIEQYYAAYDDPYVLHIRKSLDAYLNGDFSLIPEFAKESSKDENLGSVGLDSFASMYYRSKFIVWTLNDNPAGGKYVRLISKDYPDRIFDAWVYQLVDGNYKLRTFSSKRQLNGNEIEQLKTNLKQFFDDEHGL